MDGISSSSQLSLDSESRLNPGHLAPVHLASTFWNSSPFLVCGANIVTKPECEQFRSMNPETTGRV